MINKTVIAGSLWTTLVKKDPQSTWFTEDEKGYVETLWPELFQEFKLVFSPCEDIGTENLYELRSSTLAVHVINAVLIKLQEEFGFCASGSDLGQDLVVELDPPVDIPEGDHMKLWSLISQRDYTSTDFNKKEHKLIKTIFPDLRVTIYSDKRCITHEADRDTPISVGELLKALMDLYTIEDISPFENKDDSDKPIAGALLDFSRALTEVTKLTTVGAKKYSRSSWLEIKNGQERYTDAMMRHLLIEGVETVDPETLIEHDVAVAWNALARLELRLREDTNA